MRKIFTRSIRDDNGNRRIQRIRYEVVYDAKFGCYCWQKMLEKTELAPRQMDMVSSISAD